MILDYKDLLVEIGVEEIPVDSIDPAVKYIKQSFENLLKTTELAYSELMLSSTPRRFVIECKGLLSAQADRKLHRTGPAKSIAFTADGAPAPALLGFLKKNQADISQVSTESTEKGEFVCIDLDIPGRQTAEIISQWLLELLPQIPFPKKMIWNQAKLGFIRPLRWIVALWGDELLPLEAYGIKSGRTSYGNRYLGLGKEIQICSQANYCGTLREHRVIALRDERKAILRAQLESCLGQDSSQKVVMDERLIDTVTDLVEYPTAVVAEFDREFLVLPDKIISSTISQNQKYFSVVDKTGKLTNKFVFISNGDPACSEIIRGGNEKVVRARLADAMWYFKEDSAKPLESYIPKLNEVVFQSKLGTVAAKSNRIASLAVFISSELGLGEETVAKAIRAAKLCKADLVTTMLGEKEFTKLQGYIGKQYALAGGEDPEVAEAIYEHYMPKGQGDSLPETITGSLVAIADKLDTVCGIIAIGMMPTGSGDPYALRRAANGIVQIIGQRKWKLNLERLIDQSLELINTEAGIQEESPVMVRGFMKQRVEWLLQQNGIDYDVVDAVMQEDCFDVTDLIYRATALQSYRNREDFVRLVIGFKRVSNIIAAEKEHSAVNESLLTEEAELLLYQDLVSLEQKVKQRLLENDYPGTIELLVAYGSSIDLFFDKVLVNVEDTTIRQNRYALLWRIKQVFLKLADISLLVVE
ncbi:MAG: glycine--tRNA ligase subunit beta [Candidatus Cloacimonetes bacterium HGW-Cloacimonetes-2]|jgi:glycyl-tRNA synthetase beta chain|nr:MAG: glycine--tRNA ligase subunit beta [Candidatus Cloacimonetes bacterium HGW-Cloacimonetes-2]